MSGWTILTLRAKEGQDYPHSEWENGDRWAATADIVATMDNDDRIREWTTWNSHVYAYLNCPRYDFEFAERVIRSYSEMVEDAAVLGADDTSDQGTARYYPDPESPTHIRECQEKENGNVGELALSVINARHGIIARDPFHNNSGLLDENYLEDGEGRRTNK